jgi:glycerol-3-phosphate dehydrogenase
MKPHLKSGVIFLNLSKGIDNTTLRTVSDILQDELGGFDYHYAVLS